MNRLKKTLKWTGVVLGGMAAIALVANAVFTWTTDARLERQLSAIREAGDPVTLPDLARPPIPPDKNAATYLRRAEADVDLMLNELYSKKDYAEAWCNRWNAEHVMPPYGVQVIKASLQAHPQIMPLLERAAACGDYDAGLDYTASLDQFVSQLVSTIQNLRDVSRVLQLRAFMLLAEDNREEAKKSGLVLLRLARLSEHNPTCIGGFLTATIHGIAIDCLNSALQNGPVSRQLHGAVESELASLKPHELYTWMVKSERAFVLDTLRMCPANSWPIGRASQNRTMSVALDWYEGWLAISHDSRPYSQTAMAIECLSSRASEQYPHELPANVFGKPVQLLPTTQAFHRAVTRFEAMIRSLRVLNALQTHVPAGSDKVPKLSELGLPAETTTDPFNGEPLHVRKTPQGWRVYSVGQNLQDDGGKLDDYTDVGVGPPPASPSTK